MTVLTDKEQAFVGSIGITAMSTHWTSLACIVGVYLDCHALMQEGGWMGPCVARESGGLSARRGTTPKVSGREDSPGTEILCFAQDDMIGWEGRPSRSPWTLSEPLWGIHSNKIEKAHQLSRFLGLGPLTRLTLALGVARLLTRLQGLWRRWTEPAGIHERHLHLQARTGPDEAQLASPAH
jgi:hypothetical protein